MLWYIVTAIFIKYYTKVKLFKLANAYCNFYSNTLL